MPQHKHADVIIALAQGKTLEYKNTTNGRPPYWSVPQNIQNWNPIVCPDLEWRIQEETPKHTWWESYVVDNNIPVSSKEFFYEGWESAIQYQCEQGLLSPREAELLKK